MICLEQPLTRYSGKSVIKKCDRCGQIDKVSYRRAIDNYEKYSVNLCTSCSKKSNKNIRKYNYPRNFFKEINSEAKAYFLGWVASDGWMEKSRLCILVHKKDIEILEKLRNIICPMLPIIIKQNKFRYLRISSYEIVSDICKWLKISPGSKFKTVNFPDLQGELNKHFMRGLFDGDGHIIKPGSKNLSCTLASSSDSMRQKIIKFYGGNNYKDRVQWNGRKAMRFLDEIYMNAKYYLDRKFNTYLFWDKTYNENFCNNLRSETGEWRMGIRKNRESIQNSI